MKNTMSNIVFGMGGGGGGGIVTSLYAVGGGGGRIFAPLPFGPCLVLFVLFRLPPFP
jgi:hypothetical protein